MADLRGSDDFHTNFLSSAPLILGEHDNEECDDPSDTLTVPEAVELESRDPSQSPPLSPPLREDTDSDNAFSEHVQIQDSDGEGGVHQESDLFQEDDDMQQQWNVSLYMLQSQAPVAKCVCCDVKIENCPPQYGREYHGHLNREETGVFLGTEDGTYLVRQNVSDVTVLSFRMNDRVYNYRLYYEDNLHYVGENRFESVEDLVQDGLISLYLQRHNVVQTMHEGQMQSMVRRKRAERKLKQLKRVHGKRVKGLKGKKAWEYDRAISDTSLTSESVRSPSPTPSPSGSPVLSPHFVLSDTEATSQIGSAPASAVQISNVESNLDIRRTEIRRSTPIFPVFNILGDQRRTISVSSLPSIQTSSSSKETNRYSGIISTLRDAVKDDKRKDRLKLDNSSIRLKACSSDGRIKGKSAENSTPYRTYSCRVPFASSLERIADCSIKGTNSLSRSSMTALAKHTSGPKSPYFKAHQFAVHTYKGPTWCEVCHHFLWGLKHQGMRCKDCGMDIHKQCLPLTIQLECYPNKQCVKRVFGVDLTTLVKLEGGVIPKVLDELFTEIQSRDLSVEGIYRVSGQTSEVVELKEKYDEEVKVDWSQYLDISILAGAVKLYLRELPIPLITFDAYKDIMRATATISDPEDPDINWQCFIGALKLLPRAHFTTLKHLTQHLYRIHAHSAENKMTAQNLSVVFAPTLMKSPYHNNSLIKDLAIQRNFIEYLIMKNDVIFR